MERGGVAVWISWDQDDDEIHFCDVAFESLVNIEAIVYSMLERNPAYLISKISGWLSVDLEDNPSIKYVITIYGTYS